jgi:hypothetical protein
MVRINRCVDALRISPAEETEILSALEQSCRSDPLRELRPNVRYRYLRHDGVILMPAGAALRYVVRPRSLSTGGISVLHGTFVYPGTLCTILLPCLSGRRVPIEGRVVRCRCVRGRIHDVEIKFDEPIDLDDFLSTAAVPSGPEPGGMELDLDYSPPLVVQLSREIERLARSKAPREELCHRLRTLAHLLRGEPQ